MIQHINSAMVLILEVFLPFIFLPTSSLIDPGTNISEEPDASLFRVEHDKGSNFNTHHHENP
jgi:hypothetical protein